MTYAASSPVFAASRVTAASFAAFLRSKRSPAAVEASAIHAALVAAGVDPAVALGQLAAESSFGTAGYARITRNWGNIVIRWPLVPHWTRAFGGRPWKAPNGRSYASFSTWRDGARAYAALLRTYRARGWAGSISVMCRRWLGGIGTAYIANIVRIANSVPAAAPVPPKPVLVPPPITPPAPVVPPIPTTPERIAAAQPQPWGFMTHGFAGEIVTKLNAWPAWVVRSVTMVSYAAVTAPLPVYVLVHGGPQPLGNFGGADNLGNWLAARGAVAVTIDYPTRSEDGDWKASVSAIRLAIAAVRARAAAWGGDPSRITLVCHSFGGFFGELVAFAGVEVDRLVLIATEDQANAEYLASIGTPPSPRALIGSSARKVPTTVITGSADAMATVAEAQSLVDALRAAGHPGHWLVIDGATHDSILSDVGTIAAVLS